MQVTVNVTDELVREAQARGLAPKTFIEHLLAQRVSGQIGSTIFGKRIDDLDAFFAEMAARSDRTPILPLEAFTREGIYQGHD